MSTKGYDAGRGRPGGSFDFKDRRAGERDPRTSYDPGGLWGRDQDQNREGFSRNGKLDGQGPVRKSSMASKGGATVPIRERESGQTQRSSSQRPATASNTSLKGSTQQVAQQFVKDVQGILGPTTDRAVLKLRQREFELGMAKQKRESDKARSRFADFPSLREYHARQENIYTEEMKGLVDELERNNSHVNKGITQFAAHVAQPIEEFKQQVSGVQEHQSGYDARLEAIEQRLLEKEKTLAKQAEDWSKQKIYVTSLQTDLARAKQDISKLTEDNNALRNKVSSLETHVNDGQKNTLQALEKVAQSRLEEADTLKSRLETLETSTNHRVESEMADFMQKTEARVTALEEFDFDFIQEACEAVHLKLPELEKSIFKLRSGSMEVQSQTASLASRTTKEQFESLQAEVEQNRVGIREVSELLDAKIQRVQMSYDGFAERLDKKIDQRYNESVSASDSVGMTVAKNTINKCFTFISETTANLKVINGRIAELEKDSHGSRSVVPDKEAATASNNKPRDEQLPDMAPPGQAAAGIAVTPAPATASDDANDQNDWRTEQARNRLLEQRRNRMASPPVHGTQVIAAADPKLRADVDKVARSLTDVTDELSGLKLRTDYLEKSKDELALELRGSLEQLAVKVQDSGVQHAALQHAHKVLDGQLNNLTTENLYRMIAQHVQTNPPKEVVQELQSRIQDLKKIAHALDRRLADVEGGAQKAMTQEGAQKKRKFTPQLGMGMMPAIANGNH